ncbi:Zinc finger TFIIB-type domain protein [Vulcanisaeta moutnovskia 768-28]|uniref:Zinc finger TFIIB-type domain protein n=1 Tax=Vulcanisaeta moutnovskia (strain 768-28) TaxID=985053 RepID=F0QU23_VULM7|nr:transcription initiation factor IIB family protein [Vulcanisaeta moutnovskia]ADY01809.1 Zinc finger TFIIB-type domain protein [Vulcanisaeta moutnovskia 768-28]
MVTANKLIKTEKLVCPNCGSTDIVFDPERAELVCRHCGLVLEEHVMDLGPEWRAFNGEETLVHERAKPISPALPGQGLGNSVISIKHNILLHNKLRALIRLNRFNQYQYTERRIAELLDVIKPVKYELNLPDSAIEEALVLFRQLASRYDLRGVRTKDLALVLLYVACKRSRIVCPLRELRSTLNIERSKRISRLLGLVRQVVGNNDVIMKSQEELGRFLQRVINTLKLNEDVRYHVTKLAMEIINEGQRKRLTNGRTFYALVASAVYIAVTLMGIRKRQRDVAEASGVTDVTIRNRYKEVISKIDIIIEV